MNNIKCGCGRTHTLKEFLALDKPDAGDRWLGLILRNCTCKSTISRLESEVINQRNKKYVMTLRDRIPGMRAAARYLAR